MGRAAERRTTLSILCAGGVLCATGGLWAQNPRPAPPQTDPAQRRFVVIGCLSREARPPASTRGSAGGSVFTLTDPRGDKPSVYRLDGDPASLELQVGHTVEATGTLSRAGASNAAPFVLKVEKLTWIATTCRNTP
jgi:hypothetical protein